MATPSVFAYYFGRLLKTRARRKPGCGGLRRTSRPQWRCYTEALADPATRERLANIGMDIFPPSEQTSRSLGVLVKSDIEKWWPIIKAAGIKDE
jgi:hypothetical protein